MLTQARLKEVLSYDPETGIFTWIIATSNRIKSGSIAGNFGKGYVRINVDGKSYGAHRLVFLYMTGKFPTLLIDHINGIKNDNRLSNIRQATFHENAKNCPKRKNNKSGLKNVSLHKRSQKWAASARLNGKKIHLGLFENKNEAFEVYKKFAIENHGNFLHESLKGI